MVAALAHKSHEEACIAPVHRQWPASCGHDRPASRRRSDQRRTFLRFAHFNPGRLPGPAARC
jgi:hypothetical protein